MAYGDPRDDLADDGWDPYDGYRDGPPDGPEGPVGDAEDGDDGGWGADPPARQAGLRLLVGVAALLVAIGLIAAISKASDDDDDTDEVATEESSTSSSRRTTTSRLGLPGDPRSTVTTSGGGASSTSSTRATSTTRRPATTLTTVGDDDPPEPACVSAGGGAAKPVEADWAERWQTMPKPNDPATVSLCVDDITPRVGQNVVVSIVGDDPDAIFPTSECGVFITWDGPHASFCRDFVIAWEDPRPTPTEEPGHVLQHHAHVYDSPGNKTLTGSVWSAEYDGYTSPYSSRAIAALTIRVHS